MPDREQTRQEAAVLVPVYRHGRDDLRIVLIRRTEGGVHGGQIAFPGGKRDPADRSLRDTALREASEEVGLAPATTEILADLPVVETLTSRFRIFPFLARVVLPEVWLRQEREIAEVLDVRVGDLARPEAYGEAVMHFPTWPGPRQIPYYQVGPYRLWGATYRILHPLLPRLLAGEWKV